ncbi:MAG: glutamine amidotransferase family protein [Caulobacterales bacterium]|nr:glutamine amidotransferase family protein [Caulobacterales bacterium]
MTGRRAAALILSRAGEAGMCGIVGLFARTPKHEARLGALLAQMLERMSDRGPDSAGFAIYNGRQDGVCKLTIRLSPDARLEPPPDTRVLRRAGDHVVLAVPEHALEAVCDATRAAGATVVGTGVRMELFKGVGHPREVTETFGLRDLSGTHGVGHTRMATESAVTIDGAHPFNTGRDLCLVHNGSLSNHASVRRRLRAEGMTFQTENDSEVAAGYLTAQLARGMNLKESLEHALDDLDGFFTFVVGTEGGFGVLRDPIACKPAVMAETDDLIAFGSEYRAVADLPDIERARVWEPEPATAYFWERAA